MVKGLVNLCNMIITVDLNFTMSNAEAWGTCARGDPLVVLFTNLLLDSYLVDISTLKLGMTWRNRRSGSTSIGKWLDRFLVARILLPLLSQHRVWTRPSEIYDHSLICLEWMEVGRILSYPFKFIHMWLKEVPFTYLIKLA